jgi:hypothetical protein
VADEVICHRTGATTLWGAQLIGSADIADGRLQIPHCSFIASDRLQGVLRLSACFGGLILVIGGRGCSGKQTDSELKKSASSVSDDKQKRWQGHSSSILRVYHINIYGKENTRSRKAFKHTQLP